MTVYADLYFLVNAAMDFACLVTVAAILRLPKRPLRAVLAAMAGGAFALSVLLLPQAAAMVLSIPAGFALCRLGLRTGRGNARRYLLACALFFLCSAILGGALTAFYGFFGAADLLLPAGEDQLLLLLPTAAVLSFLSLFLTRRAAGARRKRTAMLEITLEGNTVRLEGLIDTGNLLREPVGGLPVVILSGDAAARLLPGGVLPEALLTGGELLPRNLRRRLRILPISGFQSRRLLPGILPDRVTVDGKVRSLCLGIDEKGRRYGGLEAIIPGELS